MRTYSYNVNGAQYGVLFDVEILGAPLTEGDLPEAAAAVAPAAAAPAPTPTAAAPAPAAKGAAGAGTPINAPLPGVVTKVLVAVGQAVKKGETVVVLEAMKMENNITDECDGSVAGVCVAAGDSVMEGTTLVTIG